MINELNEERSSGGENSGMGQFHHGFGRFMFKDDLPPPSSDVGHSEEVQVQTAIRQRWGEIEEETRVAHELQLIESKTILERAKQVLPQQQPQQSWLHYEQMESHDNDVWKSAVLRLAYSRAVYDKIERGGGVEVTLEDVSSHVEAAFSDYNTIMTADAGSSNNKYTELDYTKQLEETSTILESALSKIK